MAAADPDGVQRLPTGAHGIPAEVVARNQRERLVAAVAEACAERGYAETSVADLARRAGVSTATFYKLFPGKLECALEAHRELSERLLEAVDAACAEVEGWEAKAGAAVDVVLGLFAVDPPSARLLTVEVMALGPEGVGQNAETIESFASRLRSARGEEEAASADADWALIASISMLVGRRVMAGETDRLSELREEIVAMLTATR